MTRRLSHNSSRRTVEVHVDDDEVTFQLYDDLMPPMQSREALSRSNKSLMLIPPEELEREVRRSCAMMMWCDVMICNNDSMKKKQKKRE